MWGRIVGIVNVILTGNGRIMNSSPSQGTDSRVTAKPSRLHYIDWLRILAMLTIFFFHTNRFFDTTGWHLKNADQSFLSTAFTGILDLWLMPLSLLLSGVGSWYALKHRSGKRKLKEIKHVQVT